MINVGIILFFNAISLYYAIINKRQTWIYNCIVSVINIFKFEYFNMVWSLITNIYNIFLCLIGIIVWKKNQQENEQYLTKTFPLKHFILYLTMANICKMLSNVNAMPYSLYDSLGASAFFIGNCLLLMRNINCWYFLILNNIIYITFAIQIQDNKSSITYFVMMILSIYGFIYNHKIYNKNYAEN